MWTITKTVTIAEATNTAMTNTTDTAITKPEAPAVTTTEGETVALVRNRIVVCRKEFSNHEKVANVI